MNLEPFFYYFVIAKTPNLSNLKYKLAYISQYFLRGGIKGTMG